MQRAGASTPALLLSRRKWYEQHRRRETLGAYAGHAGRVRSPTVVPPTARDVSVPRPATSYQSQPAVLRALAGLLVVLVRAASLGIGNQTASDRGHESSMLSFVTLLSGSRTFSLRYSTSESSAESAAGGIELLPEDSMPGDCTAAWVSSAASLFSQSPRCPPRRTRLPGPGD